MDSKIHFMTALAFGVYFSWSERLERLSSDNSLVVVDAVQNRGT